MVKMCILEDEVYPFYWVERCEARPSPFVKKTIEVSEEVAKLLEMIEELFRKYQDFLRKLVEEDEE